MPSPPCFRRRSRRGRARRRTRRDCRKTAAWTCTGPPSSGHSTSQLPHSLQTSAKVGICFGLANLSAPMISTLQPSAPRRCALDRRFSLRDGEDEVGVVGAERDALVAGQAIEQDERTADLVGRRRVLRGAVARVGDHALGVDGGVQHPGGGYPGRKGLARRGAQVAARRQRGAAGGALGLLAAPARRAPPRPGRAH